MSTPFFKFEQLFSARPQPPRFQWFPALRRSVLCAPCVAFLAACGLWHPPHQLHRPCLLSVFCVHLSASRAHFFLTSSDYYLYSQLFIALCLICIDTPHFPVVLHCYGCIWRMSNPSLRPFSCKMITLCYIAVRLTDRNEYYSLNPLKSWCFRY